MSYRNKTYVAFASEDIRSYRLMEAWRDNDRIDFNFFDAHDLFIALDSSNRETIKRRLRQRLTETAKQVVLLGSANAKKKGSDGYSFLDHEIKTIIDLDLQVVVANLDGDRTVDRGFIPNRFLEEDYYTVSTSFQPTIIKHALDSYAPAYASSGKTGPHYYEAHVYQGLGL